MAQEDYLRQRQRDDEVYRRQMDESINQFLLENRLHGMEREQQQRIGEMQGRMEQMQQQQRMEQQWQADVMQRRMEEMRQQQRPTFVPIR
jgi:hypothetical protein